MKPQVCAPEMGAEWQTGRPAKRQSVRTLPLQGGNQSLDLTLKPDLSAQITGTPARALAQIMAPLEALAARSHYLISRPFGQITLGQHSYTLPRYLLLGPRGGGDPIRIGIFATIHGDEPQGALALSQFAARLEQDPELATGYALFLYPVCNPTGYEDGTRCARSGKDLNREFWRNSAEPEVQLLQTEIWTHAFHGIINLHSDDTSSGLYGFVNGEVLSKHLLEPALTAGERFLPRNRQPHIDGFPADRGIIYECYNGVLQAPAGLQHPPFEVTLETPHDAPMDLQVAAFEAALESILVEYRSLMSIAQNI
jgi:murein tripeptide amidase MpaA